MPAATFGFHFFDPSPSTHQKNEPALATSQQPPFLVMFASSPACLPTAQKLSEAGWLVLAVDIQQSTYVELALDLISPLSLYAHWKWLKPAAILLVNDEPRLVQPNPLTQPVLSLPLRRLISLLLGRGLSVYEIPYLLYLNAPNSSLVPANLEEPTSTAAAKNPLQLDKVDSDTTSSIFRAILPQTVKDEALLTVIADLTQVFFCAGCRSRIEPQEKALLLAPQLFCEGCASFPSAVLDRYPQEKLPLFPARFLAKAARVFATWGSYKIPGRRIASEFLH